VGQKMQNFEAIERVS